MNNLNRIYFVNYLFIVFFILSCPLVTSQPALNQKINATYKNITLEEVLNDITKKTGIKFSYSPQIIDLKKTISLQFKNNNLSEVLEKLGKEAGFKYELIGEYFVLTNNPENMADKEIPEIKLVTISGYITDSVNKEIMIGATVYEPQSQVGIMTNNYGFYSLSLPEGIFTLEVSFLGYAVARKQFNTNNNIIWNVNLEPKISSLDEVLISSIDREQEIFTSLSGQTNIKAFEVKQQSAALGETDVLKTLDNLPGISFHNDGSSYFYVRGGQRDQNLILLDDAPLYNPSHLFGFFTPVIPDAVKNTEIYKADFPIQYGGRLSSVIDIRSRDGNMEKFAGSASIGLITNRESVEGPLKKGKSSYFISHRRSHIGFLFKKVSPGVNDFYFKDLTAKFNIMLGQKDRLFITFYHGKDIYLIEENNESKGIEWGNSSLTLRWNHIFGSRLFSNTTFYTSKFDYFLHTDYKNKKFWNSRISSANIKSEYTLFLGPDHKIRFGFNFGGYFFNPGNINLENFLLRYSVSTVNSSELVIYAGNEHNFFEWLHINYGFRLSNWSDFGESFVVNYDEYYNVTEIKQYNKGEKYYSKGFIEPRISVSFKTGLLSSFKVSYNRTIQNINLINNSISPFNTLEVWLPSGPNIKPQKADIYNISFLKSWLKPRLDLNFDVFYKKMQNIIGYTNHAGLLLNPLLEGQLRQGHGDAYGFELYVRKTVGKVSGQAGYAYTRSYAQIDGLNKGQGFNPTQDKPVDFSVLLNYQLKPRIMFNMNYLYSSGMRITSPVGFYDYRGSQVPYYDEIYNNKLPDYKRFDLGVTFNLNKVKRNFEHNLNISMFNFFNYHNPAFINFNKIYKNDEYLVPADKLNPDDQVATYRYVYEVIPSITYNISF